MRIFAAPEPRILRSPHWQRPSRDVPTPLRRKEAG
jgi:hypothetical protein